MAENEAKVNVVPFPRIFSSAVASFISRVRLSSFFGNTYGGARKMQEVLGYKQALVFEDFNFRYCRGGIASRIVDAFPNVTWRNPPVVADKSGTNSRFAKEFATLSQRLKLFHYLDRVDRLSGIGQYGVLLIGTAGGASLSSPIGKVKNQEGVLYLSCYTQGNAGINKLVDDAGDERFGMPLEYKVRLFNDVAGLAPTSTSKQEQLVHSSRMIHVAEGLGEDEIFGVPRLERCWNLLDDLDKIVGGSSEAVWRTVDRGIQFDIDKDAELDPADEAKFSKEIEDYMHGFQRFIRTQGVKATPLGSEVPDPTGPAGTVLSLISGTVNIPKRILVGAEQGQMAGDQDQQNFLDRVRERQVSFAEPFVLRQTIDRFISIGALPEPTGGEYTVEWPDIATQSRKQKADVAARFAQAIANLATQGRNGGLIVCAPGEFREKFLDLPTEVPEVKLVQPPQPKTTTPAKDGKKQPPISG